MVHDTNVPGGVIIFKSSVARGDLYLFRSATTLRGFFGSRARLRPSRFEEQKANIIGSAGVSPKNDSVKSTQHAEQQNLTPSHPRSTADLRIIFGRVGMMPTLIL